MTMSWILIRSLRVRPPHNNNDAAASFWLLDELESLFHPSVKGSPVTCDIHYRLTKGHATLINARDGPLNQLNHASGIAGNRPETISLRRRCSLHS